MSSSTSYDDLVKTRAQRLSAMIDSLQDDKDGTSLYYPFSSKSSPIVSRKQPSKFKTPPKMLVHALKSNSNETTPSLSTNRTSSLVSPLKEFTPGDRESMFSDYAGSIHEGIQVSYMVSKGKHNLNTHEPKLPPLPSHELDKPLEFDFVSEEPLEIKHSDLSPTLNVTEMDTKIKKEDSTISITNKIPLMLAPSEHRYDKRLSSIGSGNLASESGHSNYYSNSEAGTLYYPLDNMQPRFVNEKKQIETIHENIDENFTQEWKFKEYSDIKLTGSVRNLDAADDVYQDMGSVFTNTVSQLSLDIPNIKLEDEMQDYSTASDHNTIVPPRNKNRPKSQVFVKQEFNGSQYRFQEEMITHPYGMKNHLKKDSKESFTKSDTYFSAADFEIDKFGSTAALGFPQHNVSEQYIHRPLPHTPNKIYNQNVENMTLRGSSSNRYPESHNFPTMPIEIKQESNDEDEYEDIEDEDAKPTHSKQDTQQLSEKSSDLRIPQSKLPKTPKSHARKKSSKNNSHRKEIRSFDVDTIAQLLNVTKGTLIGSEFSNLGMRTEEKRALERLVDSLSRLSADMVLDPERYDEGLKRLDKATRALEGF